MHRQKPFPTSRLLLFDRCKLLVNQSLPLLVPDPPSKIIDAQWSSGSTGVVVHTSSLIAYYCQCSSSLGAIVGVRFLLAMACVQVGFGAMNTFFSNEDAAT